MSLSLAIRKMEDISAFPVIDGGCRGCWPGRLIQIACVCLFSSFSCTSSCQRRLKTEWFSHRIQKIRSLGSMGYVCGLYWPLASKNPTSNTQLLFPYHPSTLSPSVRMFQPLDPGNCGTHHYMTISTKTKLPHPYPPCM